ncbi:MAG: class I SAM-dependent methyltransferase [Lentisphaerae bacterium]|jgi:SAM-dependent methyltransferase|nr:class I SAM-dependent methyltransferase [Lentisphaerota bacterium]MBT4821901.1 class I SAM-dependent methyltransferase [Lentisphaerota bacterium]MBT5609994.1 class I SAM-dependent methyltransferase [Lentisphaerota bacterium]MBT7059117.1 class I SAM-dependent methyltransferase [Lentisphaerota bacterium]MBT7841439.1 class I SAM-dependent methyltransferase [Lentisphaerota bacterium]
MPWPISATAVRALQRFNQRWTRRLTIFRRHAGVPLWAAGVVVDARLRQSHERYLPVGEFCDGLYTVAQYALPHVTWVPGVLCGPRQRPLRGPRNRRPLSLPDLWAALPVSFAGRLTFRPDEVVPLLCALADPPRHGTRAGRYPVQLAGVREWLGSRRPGPVRALDIGCGVGHGTLELANALDAAEAGMVACVGVTAEPLEVWMATHRRLPHDPAREDELAALPVGKSVLFLAGTGMNVPCRGGFQLVVCNGLVGGDFLSTAEDFRALLRELDRLLAEGGLVSLANRFHEGAQQRVRSFAGAAVQAGWCVRGDEQLLWLSR